MRDNSQIVLVERRTGVVSRVRALSKNLQRVAMHGVQSTQ